MLSLAPTVRVFIAVEPVDMRGSFDALAGAVRRLGLDPVRHALATLDDGRSWSRTDREPAHQPGGSRDPQQACLATPPPSLIDHVAQEFGPGPPERQLRSAGLDPAHWKVAWSKDLEMRSITDCSRPWRFQYVVLAFER